MRIINSTDIFLYALGFYSFFEKYSLGCAPNQDCQSALVETNFAARTWLYNIFTVGNIEIVSPLGRLDPIFYDSGTRNGYTSSVAAWLALGLSGGEIGSGISPSDPSDGTDVVYIDNTIYNDAENGRTATVQCRAPCTYVFPPIQLDRPTTITLPGYTTSLEVGYTTRSTYLSGFRTVTSDVFATTTITTVLRPPPITTTEIEVSNVVVRSSVSSTTIKIRTSLSVPTFTITNPSISQAPTQSRPVRTITPPPYPWPTDEPDPEEDDPEDEDDDGNDDDDDSNVVIPVIHIDGPPKPICRRSCGIRCRIFCKRCLLFCDPGDQLWGKFFTRRRIGCLLLIV